MTKLVGTSTSRRANRLGVMRTPQPLAMKTTAVFVFILASALGASGQTTVILPSPQPRPRLPVTPPPQFNSAAEAEAAGDSVAPVVLAPILVEDTKQRLPKPEDTKPLPTLSALKGNAWKSITRAPLAIDVGLMSWHDLLAEDAKFESTPGAARVEVARVRF